MPKIVNDRPKESCGSGIANDSQRRNAKLTSRLIADFSILTFQSLTLC